MAWAKRTAAFWAADSPLRTAASARTATLRTAAVLAAAAAKSIQRPGGGYYAKKVDAGQILTLAIVSFFCIGIILGPYAAFKANGAIAAINAGLASSPISD